MDSMFKVQGLNIFEYILNTENTEPTLPTILKHPWGVGEGLLLSSVTRLRKENNKDDILEKRWSCRFRY